MTPVEWNEILTQDMKVKFPLKVLLESASISIYKYLQLSDEMKNNVHNMLNIIYSETNVSDDEREMAITTVWEALFPSEPVDIEDWHE